MGLDDEKHDGKEYREVPLGDLSKFFPATLVAGEKSVYDVTGICPECNVRVHRRFKQKVVGEINILKQDLDPKRLHTMPCECNLPHPGRDDKAGPPFGCGAFWEIHL